jgi:apolipoprotein N-acyltransferase
MVEEVRFLSGRTIYSRIGDLVAWIAIMLTIAALIVMRRSTSSRRAA